MSDPWVTPCRSCGQAGNNFDLRRHRDGPFGLIRYCVACQSEIGKRYREAHLERVQRRDREYQRARHGYGARRERRTG